ncbi:MAG: thioredoxin family protein [Oscillospiraceae bacterium]|nr:thioredoxin family protein [Oscillospiraceae bacterium]
MDNKKTDKKKLFVKILVPVLIAVSLTVIWIVKTHPTPTQIDENGNIADFVLEAESIDLEALKAYGLPIIIDFGSDSCIPCKAMAPVLQTMNAEMQGKVIIKFVDVWKHAGAADGYPIQYIPTQIFFNTDGIPYVPSNNIGIEFTMYDYKDTGAHAFTVHQGGLTEDQMRVILADMGIK